MVMQEIKKTREMEKFHCYILFEEVKEKVRMLKSYGIGDDEIDTLLHDDEIFPKLTITKDYKIVIGEENQSEIEMEPLVKAIYLLFLSHPELNASAVSRRLGINQSLMAQYINGTKKPSKERERQILEEISKIGKELQAVSL